MNFVSADVIGLITSFLTVEAKCCLKGVNRFFQNFSYKHVRHVEIFSNKPVQFHKAVAQLYPHAKHLCLVSEFETVGRVFGVGQGSFYLFTPLPSFWSNFYGWQGLSSLSLHFEHTGFWRSERDVLSVPLQYRFFKQLSFLNVGGAFLLNSDSFGTRFNLCSLDLPKLQVLIFGGVICFRDRLGTAEVSSFPKILQAPALEVLHIVPFSFPVRLSQTFRISPLKLPLLRELKVLSVRTLYRLIPPMEAFDHLLTLLEFTNFQGVGAPSTYFITFFSRECAKAFKDYGVATMIFKYGLLTIIPLMPLAALARNTLSISRCGTLPASSYEEDVFFVLSKHCASSLRKLELSCPCNVKCVLPSVQLFSASVPHLQSLFLQLDGGYGMLRILLSSLPRLEVMFVVAPSLNLREPLDKPPHFRRLHLDVHSVSSDFVVTGGLLGVTVNVQKYKEYSDHLGFSITFGPTDLPSLKLLFHSYADVHSKDKFYSGA